MQWRAAWHQILVRRIRMGFYSASLAKGMCSHVPDPRGRHGPGNVCGHI